MNANERYERDAEQFYRETGMMAPGKDDAGYSSHSIEAREAAWRAWLKQRSSARPIVPKPEGLCTACSTEPCAEHAKHNRGWRRTSRRSEEIAYIEGDELTDTDYPEGSIAKDSAAHGTEQRLEDGRRRPRRSGEEPQLHRRHARGRI